MIIGYVRVSTVEQDVRMQLDKVTPLCNGEIFRDEGISGKSMDRVGLNNCLFHLREGDTLVIYSLSRLGRNTIELIKFVQLLEEKKVNLISCTENIDTSTAMGRFFFTLLSSLAQLEREMTEERRIQGVLAAREAGVKFGRKVVLSEDALLYIKTNPTMPVQFLMDKYGVSRSSIMRARRG